MRHGPDNSAHHQIHTSTILRPRGQLTTLTRQSQPHLSYRRLYNNQYGRRSKRKLITHHILSTINHTIHKNLSSTQLNANSPPNNVHIHRPIIHRRHLRTSNTRGHTVHQLLFTHHLRTREHTTSYIHISYNYRHYNTKHISTVGHNHRTYRSVTQA